MGRYAKFRNFKYLAYPFFLERMVAAAARETKFDLLFSQHAISAVAAGKLKRKLGVPVVMNFPDLLTGFMETWPGYVAPKPLVRALMRYEISLPVRYGVDGVCAISDEFAERLAARGYPREKILPDLFRLRAQSIFHFVSSRPRPTARRSSSCTVRLTRITLAGLRSTPAKLSRRKGRKRFSVSSASAPPDWKNFCNERRRFPISNLSQRFYALRRSFKTSGRRQRGHRAL